MNFLKSMLGYGAKGSESERYAEFTDTSLACMLYHLESESTKRSCECMDGAAGFDLKENKESSNIELSAIVTNKLYDES